MTIKKYMPIACLMALVLVGCGSTTATTAEKQPEQKKQVEKKEVEWNKKEINVSKNGNLPTAIASLKTAGDIKAKATAANPGDVFKAPWNFYGQIVKLTGAVGIVQEYPPDSDFSKAMGGSGSEIVLMADDGTIVDFALVGATKDTKVGDQVTVYGYPVGQDEVQNKMGGTTTQLVVVGSAFEKTSSK